MNELLTDLLMAVLTAAIPILSAFAISLISKARDKATAQTDNIKQQWYITEIADAISAAVSATSQTYVDELKETGSFDKEAQKEAARKALVSCLTSISPAARTFIEAAYGDLTEYLANRIEAEVRKQNNEVAVSPPATLESTVAGATAVAASTAAATAATIAQTAMQRISAEPSLPEK